MPQPKIESRRPRQFIMEDDRSIRIRMRRSNSVTLGESSHRPSISSRRSVESASTININLAGVDFIPNIPHLIYKPDNKSESPPMSPTASQILSVITLEENFEIDKPWISEDFEADYNKEKRSWYFSTFSKEQVGNYLQQFYVI